MIYIFYLLLILPDSQSWFFDKSESNKEAISNNYNEFNPICWVTHCEENIQKTEGNTEFTLDPRCRFTACDKKKKINFNPYYWFTNDERNGDENFWLTDEEIINWGKAKLENIRCWFKTCPVKEKEADLTVTDKSKGFFNDLKHPKTFFENFLKSGWNPYCWHIECCSENSIPSNTTGKYLQIF